MGQFSTETRKWLESAIRQRRMLLRLNKSHKPEQDVQASLSALDTLLKAYRYENDLFMARFVRQNIGHIETILPGEGATNHNARKQEFERIGKRAVQIILSQGEVKSLPSASLRNRAVSPELFTF